MTVLDVRGTEGSFARLLAISVFVRKSQPGTDIGAKYQQKKKKREMGFCSGILLRCLCDRGNGHKISPIAGFFGSAADNIFLFFFVLFWYFAPMSWKPQPIRRVEIRLILQRLRSKI